VYELVSNDQVAESWSELLVQPLKGMEPAMRPGRGGKIAAAIRAGNFWAQLDHDRTAVRASPGGRSRAGPAKHSGIQAQRESREDSEWAQFWAQSEIANPAMPCKQLVRKGGLEPPRVSPPDPKSGASANSATLAALAKR
jgi:hypothetical protein